ncbi:hypothetical protein [Litchfieldella rifensis]|uniref:Uncharacterized protein n=1 Tax=Litchfieldella rifensis TaxID=762643 RepID=A0ABV7LVY3_9GAMM
MLAGRRQLPLWLKLAFSLWILFWAPTYVVLIGAQNFFWLCDLANFLLLVGLWTESRRLLSMQLLSVLLVGVLWAVDVGTALVTGVHPIGGTEYMFDPGHPPVTRALSLFHLILPIVAVFAVSRLGYDRPAIFWQTALTWLVIPLSYVFTDPERNINWVQGPFGQPQDSLDPLVYLVGLMLLWPLVIYLPVHLLLIGLQHWRVRHRQ